MAQFTKNQKLMILGGALVVTLVLLAGALWAGQQPGSGPAPTTANVQPIQELPAPYSNVSRTIPQPGESALVLAADLGADSQTTVEGAMREVYSQCLQMNTGAAYRAVCQSAAFPQADYLQWTTYEYGEDQEISFVAGYFGAVDPSLVPPFGEMPVAIEGLRDSEPLTSATAIYVLLERMNTIGSLGNFSTNPNAAVQFFYTAVDGEIAYVWTHGNWLYLAAAPNLNALDHFVETIPF